MNQPNNEQDMIITSLFSDGTPLFRSPAEPDPGDTVSLRLRIRRGTAAQVSLLRDFPAVRVPMAKYRSDDAFDWYEAQVCCGDAPIFYSFLVAWEGSLIHYSRLGAKWVEAVPAPDPGGSFRIIPGFHVPDWAKGAVQYQIFADRFRNGSPQNDVQDREYYYSNDYIHAARFWSALPEQDDFRCIYGGDLVGVLEKLDYLQSLGVEAIYLNPIFVSPSNHKYDTQDYYHVDPHLTVIPRDGGDVLPEGEHSNTKAELYIRRTTDPENLKASDEWFAGFCQEVHRRGMKLILDGVFNHCGSFNQWMDKERIYPGGKGAYGHSRSPYRSYFLFRDHQSYHCWWNIETVPKLYYEQSSALCQEIFSVAEKWVSPPYSVDGWRLDVAADLGRSRAFNHLFWQEFRRRVKAANPNAVIIAEHYGNPEEWLGGNEWDSVMNYDAFMDPLSFFLTGMEKHSDYRKDDLYQNGEAFFDSILEAMSHMPTASVLCAMDELSNHDHSRFMTRTNGRVGRLNTLGSGAASEGIRPAVFREAAVIQMTWPGAPTIYYGDEAGLTGWTDPDNRRTYPWGGEDQTMIGLYRTLAKLRQEHPALRLGSMKKLCAGHGYIAFARFDADDLLVIACNNTESEMEIDLPVRDIGLPDGALLHTRLVSNADGYILSTDAAGFVREGILRYTAPAQSAAILTPGKA